LVVISITGFLLYPRLKVYSLERQLHAAQSPVQTAGLVRKLLACDTDYALDVVAQYASESPLRAFDRKHRIFLLHDDSTGATHEVVLAPQGTVVIKDTALSSSEHDSLVRAGQAAMPRTTSVSFTIGKPPLIFAGMQLVGREQDHQRGTEKVTFVLKERGSAQYHAVIFQFEQARLISEGLYGVSETDLLRWQQAESWPKEWNQ